MDFVATLYPTKKIVHLQHKNSKTAQKIIKNLCMFVDTFRGQGDTIITVKTPQYIIYFLLSP